MNVLPYILATAGHVDHGKSSLVRALTGTDPDRLPEEKARGITIELGFAHVELPSPPTVQPPAMYRVGIVDVPGHEDFVKNMVAGVGSIDAALLVVAADDEWMPQTEEHLQILIYLGVRRGVVALTKADLPDSVDASIQRVRARLANSPLAEAPIVPTSVLNGRGIDELKAALADVFATTPQQRDAGKPRLPIDRAFVLKGIGTVVTGTLAGGSLRRDQSVIVQPTGATARVRNVQTHNSDVAVALPGSRVALNLPELHPSAGRTSRAPHEIWRGDVVTLPDAGRPTDTWDVVVERIDRDPVGSPPPPLKSGARIQVHHGSAALPARLYLLDAADLPPGSRAAAQLRLDKPALALDGDRFVIRDWPEQHTLAGGVVLDALATREGWRSPARRGFLASRIAAPTNVRTFVASRLTLDGIASRQSIGGQSRFARADVDAAIASLLESGAAIARGDVIATPNRWSTIRTVAEQAIDAEHRAHPEKPGLAIPDLRAALEKADAPAPAIDAVIDELCRADFVRSGTTVRRATFRPALPPRLQSAGAKIRASLAAHPFDPPSRKELAPDATAQQALRFLIINGEAADLSPDTVISTDAYHRAIAVLRAHLRTHGPATVSELKTLLGSSRRIMVPLLERLDRDGVTRRDGDRRLLREPAPRT